MDDGSTRPVVGLGVGLEGGCVNYRRLLGVRSNSH